MLGKQMPFGLESVIGVAGNATFARLVIRGAKRAFGPPPEKWPSHFGDEPPVHGAPVPAALT